MFTDRTDLIHRNRASLDSGIAVADCDGDGRFEFIVTCADGPNRVLKWVGSGLQDIVSREVADEYSSASAIVAGDFDGDGIEELYVVNANCERSVRASGDRFFKRTLEGRWSDLLRANPFQRKRSNASFSTATAIDRRGTGRYGIVVGRGDGSSSWVEIGMTGDLVDLAVPLELDRMGSVHGSLAAPLLGPHTDLFCTSESGANILLRNRGDGSFEDCAPRLSLADGREQSRCAAVIDDGVGWSLCWGNRDGPHRFARKQREGSWKDCATPAFAFPSAVRSIIVADFDNDGRDELFFHNHGEPNRLFRLADSASVVSDANALSMLDPGEALEPFGTGTAAVVADVDGDGVLELLLAHGESTPQPLSLYRAAQATRNNWFRVLPQTRFGAPARGALVTIRIGERLWSKVIDGGGSSCQLEPVAHFGLGKGNRIDTVAVQWPDGAQLTFGDPDLNCTYAVPYPRD